MRFTEEIRQELTERILPFWQGLRDDTNGGYVGRVDYDLTRHPEALRFEKIIVFIDLKRTKGTKASVLHFRS